MLKVQMLQTLRLAPYLSMYGVNHSTLYFLEKSMSKSCYTFLIKRGDPFLACFLIKRGDPFWRAFFAPRRGAMAMASPKPVKKRYISALRLDAAFMASPSLASGFFFFISL